DHGLNVEIDHGRGSAVTAQSVGSGQDDFGHANIGPALNAIDEGYDTQVVSTLTNRNSWVLYSDENNPIESINDIEGKNIVLSSGTPDVYLTEAVLADNNVEVSDVSFQQVDPSS